MMFALTLALVASTAVGSHANPPAVARSNDDPPIQLWLSSNNRFVRGDRARVYVRAAKDGYVVVLRADAQGHVRVLFPLDPSNDEGIRGDRKFEVEGDGGHEAFTVDEGDGTGMVLAAWSESPFTFDAFAQGDQWDEHALDAQQSSGDREATIVEIVQGMAGDNHFDYDVANYTVNSVTAYNDGSEADDSDTANNDRPNNEGSYNEAPYYGPYYGGPYYGPWFGPAYGGLSVSLGFGHGVFCDGFYWSTWGCGPFYDPFFPPLVYRPFVYRSYRPFGGARFGGYYGSSSIGRNRGYGFRSGTSWSGARPRVRVPAGGSRVVYGSNRSVVRERTGTRSSATGSRSLRGARSTRPSYAPRGERVGGSAPSTRSAPSSGSRGGGVRSAAPRSSGGGYARSSGGHSRGSGGYSRGSGGYSRGSGGHSRGSGSGGGGGGGRRAGGGGGGGGRRH
jgi:Domain of unknown function (DUF4384)